MRVIYPDQYANNQIDEINELAKSNPKALIERSERLYHAQLEAVARQVAGNIEKSRFIMLSGHSASGKTTTAHKLSDLIAAHGFHSRVVSLDDFYLDRDKTPMREDGTLDLETVHSLDIPCINECFTQLFEMGRADFPRFDFITASRKDRSHTIHMTEKSVIIIEGIHALNPLLTCTVPDDEMLRVFVSVRSKFVRDGKDVLRPKDIRLIRRMVRDQNYRNAHPIRTMDMWEDVARGEREHINPFRDNADIKIDSTIDYEPCIYKMFVQPLLREVRSIEAHHGNLLRIYEALHLFVPISELLIPEDTLLREFISL